MPSIITNNNNPSFKSFYAKSAWLEEKALMNRGLVVAINDAAWLAMANNNTERKEKARRMGYFFFMSFITPIITLPVTNRLAMKSFSKLTKSFWSNEHKLIHISNEFLKDKSSLQKGMKELSKNYSNSPLETLYYKIRGKKPPKTPLNFDLILEKCGGKTDEGYEALRKKLVNTKTGILFSDFLLTSLATGLCGYINNNITKKRTGQVGFSAEFNMADKSVIEKRAQQYEKTKKQKLFAFLITTLAVAATTPLLLRKGLIKNPTGKISSFMRKHAVNFDYGDGIYMKRLSLLLGGCLMSQVGAMIFSRNKTELKDTCIRYPVTDVIFFGGDLMIASFLANICDKTFKTKLSKPAQNKFQKIFPKFKSLKELQAEVSGNKKTGLALYWLTFIGTTALIGVAVPALVNAIIRKDVKEDAKKNIAVKPLSTENKIYQQFNINKSLTPSK